MSQKTLNAHDGEMKIENMFLKSESNDSKKTIKKLDLHEIIDEVTYESKEDDGSKIDKFKGATMEDTIIKEI